MEGENRHQLINVKICLITKTLARADFIERKGLTPGIPNDGIPNCGVPKNQFSEFRSSEFRVFHAEFRIENENYGGPQYHILHVVSSREGRFHRVLILKEFFPVLCWLVFHSSYRCRDQIGNVQRRLL